MTPRRHVLVELDPDNHAVATLKARLRNIIHPRNFSHMGGW